jgi:nitrous oxidase accessory protein NosD
MKRVVVTFSLVAALGLATVAQAQATRTWVSGLGDDANPCSRTAPCKTFSGAISKTAAGGEIDVLDPGGFGGVTITKSLKIDGGPFAGGVLVGGTNGVLVNALSTDTITLRNLAINGTNFAGSVNGVRVIGAKAVNLEGCEIYNFGSRGVSLETSTNLNVTITDTIIRNNVSSGIVAAPSGGVTRLTVNNSRIFNNGGHGIDTVSLTNSHINSTLITGNTNAGVFIEQATNTGSINDCFIANNDIGIEAGSSGQTPAVFLSHSMVVLNLSQGLLIQAGAQVVGFTNNAVANNGGNNFVTSSRTPQ